MRRIKGLVVTGALITALLLIPVLVVADVAVTITILPLVAPTVTAQTATSVTSVSALLHGTITKTGNNDPSIRGFEWGYATGNYTHSWNETGSFGVGAFEHGISGLTLGMEVFWRAFAINTVGTGYSGERSFWTLLLPLAPTNFAITQTGPSSINITWDTGPAANWTLVRASDSHYPTDTADGYIVYNGTGTYVTINDLSLSDTVHYYSAWSGNDYGYSVDHAEANTGGTSMASIIIMLLLGALAAGLTIAMFVTRNMLLGFPSAIFWGILGGYSYQQSLATWDWQYFLFFAAMGMVLFSVLAMFALRKRDLAEPDADEGAFIDEGGSPGARRRPPQPRKPPALGHDREPQLAPQKGGSWGDIDELGMHDLTDNREVATRASSTSEKNRKATTRLRGRIRDLTKKPPKHGEFT